MFRKATAADVDCIEALYNEIHTQEEAGNSTIGWMRTVYPTRKTAPEAVVAGEMFVLEQENAIVAAARINKQQMPEYAEAAWSVKAPSHEVMVLHTLVVSPKEKGKGYGTCFVKFYEDMARREGCRYLRMDTNAKNTVARALYQKLGYREVSVVPCVFNGIPSVSLVCLEKIL